MLTFDAPQFFQELENVGWIEAWLPDNTGDADYEKRYAEVLEDFDDIAEQCKTIGLDDGADEAMLYKAYALESKNNPKGIQALGRVLVTSLRAKLDKRVFLWVKPNCTALVDNNNGWGAAVSAAFPSSRRDIKEAGNCLACDCGTGAVFHLMRATEVALRALARDRRVTFPKGSIEQKQWGEILGQLRAEIGELGRRDSKNWPSDEVRQAQIRFYQEAVVMFNAFNDVWRRHVAHAHDGAFYEARRAIAIWNDTKRFMTQLANRISEHAVGDEYWKAI
jgi:hypothetical protein